VSTHLKILPKAALREGAVMEYNTFHFSWKRRRSAAPDIEKRQRLGSPSIHGDSEGAQVEGPCRKEAERARGAGTEEKALCLSRLPRKIR